MARELSYYEKQSADALELKIKSYEREVNKLLVAALNEIRILMSKTYEKYAVDGILTKAEMSRYNRLQTLETQLLAITKPTTDKIVSILNRAPPEMYGESFFRYAWAIDEAVQVALKWGPLNRDLVIEQLDNPIDKIAVERYKKTAPYAVRIALQNGLITGQSYTAMIKDFKKYANASSFEALRILRTEATTAQNAGQADSYIKARQQGVEGKRVWVATLDGRTRDTHGEADGQKEDDKGMFHVGGETGPYPGWAGFSAENRINERCTTRFEIEGFSPQIRRSKEQGVIPYQTYSEWKAERKTWA